MNGGADGVAVGDSCKVSDSAVEDTTPAVVISVPLAYFLQEIKGQAYEQMGS